MTCKYTSSLYLAVVVLFCPSYTFRSLSFPCLIQHWCVVPIFVALPQFIHSYSMKTLCMRTVICFCYKSSMTHVIDLTPSSLDASQKDLQSPPQKEYHHHTRTVKPRIRHDIRSYLYNRCCCFGFAFKHNITPSIRYHHALYNYNYNYSCATRRQQYVPEFSNKSDSIKLTPSLILIYCIVLLCCVLISFLLLYPVKSFFHSSNRRSCSHSFKIKISCD